MADNFFEEEHAMDVSLRTDAEKERNIWADFDAVINMARKPKVTSQLPEAGCFSHHDVPETEPVHNTTSSTPGVSSLVPKAFPSEMTRGDPPLPLGKLPSNADRTASNGSDANLELMTQQPSSENSASPLIPNSSQEDARSPGMTSPQVDDWLAMATENRRYLSPVDQEFHRISPALHRLSPPPIPGVGHLRLQRDSSPFGQQLAYPPTQFLNPAVSGLMRYRASPHGQSGMIQRNDDINRYPIRFVGNCTGSRILNRPTPASGLPVSRVQSLYSQNLDRSRSSGEKQIQRHISVGTCRSSSSMESRKTLSPLISNVLSTCSEQRASHMPRHRRPRGAAMPNVLGTSAHASIITEKDNEQKILYVTENKVKSPQTELQESTENSEFSIVDEMKQPSDSNSDRCGMDLQFIDSFADSGSSPRVAQNDGSVLVYDLEGLDESPGIAECKETVRANRVDPVVTAFNVQKKKWRVRRFLTDLQKCLRRAGRRFWDLTTACATR